VKLLHINEQTNQILLLQKALVEVIGPFECFQASFSEYGGKKTNYKKMNISATNTTKKNFSVG
jgi:hypothetical protein